MGNVWLGVPATAAARVVWVGGRSVFNGAWLQLVTAFFWLLGCQIMRGRSLALVLFWRRAPAPSEPSLQEAWHLFFFFVACLNMLFCVFCNSIMVWYKED